METTPTNTPDQGQEDGQSLKDSSLKYSGYAYLVSDAALFVAGILNGNIKEALTGLIWAGGGLTAAGYGKSSTEQQLKSLSFRLRDYLRKEGIEIPQDSTLQREYLDKYGDRVVNKINDFLYRHPSQVLNTIFGVGGATLAVGKAQTGDYWKAGSGVLVSSGALAGLLIPERNEEEIEEIRQQKTRNPITKLWNWIQERPLRLTSMFYTANNVTLLKGGWDEMKLHPERGSHYFTYLAGAGYLVANGLLALSSTDYSKESVDQRASSQDLEKLAAEVVAGQPKDVQEHVINHVSGFLASQPEVSMSAVEIARHMRNAINNHDYALENGHDTQKATPEKEPPPQQPDAPAHTLPNGQPPEWKGTVEHVHEHATEIS